ncbi:MAG: UDP-N-acetylmuramoyl-L-alanine--D-glutamate ligase [Minwuiales bacterium]|nr:UDP-N-acetylmuramoyl-L-alanine--D-glutamate ligase [Minwuiales bacterium]
MIVANGFRDRKVAVFGLGRSGLAAARALAAGGAEPLVWDDSAEGRAQASEAGLALADPLTMDWDGVETLVLSPGVPLTHPKPHPVVGKAKAASAEIIGDVEVFMRSTAGIRKTAITGTNGKSTTTALIGHILKESGRATEIGGNLGTPVLDLKMLDSEGDYVIEMSSYQIDLTPSMIADVAVLLNISPDHLDRHGDMAGYVAVKKRVFSGQSAGDVAVIGIDDSHCAEIWEELRQDGAQSVVPVSVGRALEFGVYVIDGVLHDAAGGAGGAVVDLNEIASLPGRHNWQNAAAAFTAAQALGLQTAVIAAGLRTFPGLAHRMERVDEIDGVVFINDSKATNADAAARALACYDTIYWIAGGQAKSGGIEPLSPYFDRIRHAFLIGEAANAFAATLDGKAPYTISGDLEAAVEDAWRKAKADGLPGAVVLLSPSCASFDQYRNFEIRGDAFRDFVRQLDGGRPWSA